MARVGAPESGGRAAPGSKRKAKRSRVGDPETAATAPTKRKTPSKGKAAAASKASVKREAAAKSAARTNVAKAKSPSKSKLALRRKTKAALKFKPRAQYAALPFRLTGEMEILLVTSRETARWVIPKGWPIRGKSRRATAAAEARQEAGLLGEIGKTPLGQYDYVKVLKTGVGLPCRVTVFPLLVTGHKLRWREQTQRSSQWFDPASAAQCVQEPQLSEIIRRFAADYLALARALAGRTPES